MADAINTHTWYAHYARMIKKANEELQTVQKYLDPSSPNYYPAYIDQLKAKQEADPALAGIAQKISDAEGHLANFRRIEARARLAIAEYPPRLQSLTVNEDFWRAPDTKQNEYLYILDEESCVSTCVDWLAVATECEEGKWGIPVTLPAMGCSPYQFTHKTITYTTPQQTDAVRIWNHHAVLDALTITDERVYDEAHRDAIQLIPPPQYQEVVISTGGVLRLKLADQMAGTILESPTVKNCVVKALHAPLQGIFMSDGLCRNALIQNNDIQIKGAHAISLAGLLSGVVSGNTLRQVPPDATGYTWTPSIRLYPLRIGGNIADDGVVCVLDFTAQASVQYGTVTGENNQLIQVNGAVVPLAVEDLRHQLPDNFVKIGIGLNQFDYDTYFSEYSTWTVNDFRANDAWGYAQMVAWINLRLEEYTSGQRETGSPLPEPTIEQKATGPYSIIAMLTQAQHSLAQATDSFMNTRLADLQETAIRSFTMKRIALRNGVVMPFKDLGFLLNNRREAMLRWLLESV